MRIGPGYGRQSRHTLSRPAWRLTRDVNTFGAVTNIVILEDIRERLKPGTAEAWAEERVRLAEAYADAS